MDSRYSPLHLPFLGRDPPCSQWQLPLKYHVPPLPPHLPRFIRLSSSTKYIYFFQDHIIALGTSAECNLFFPLRDNAKAPGQLL